MVNYCIYARDYSGSTARIPYYHTNGLLTYQQFKKDVGDMSSSGLKPKAVCLHWSTECKEVNENTLVRSYNKHEGMGGTMPQSIIKWIQATLNLQRDSIKLLYIISDGLISFADVEQCAVLNENVNYEKVVFHAISQNLDAIDLSVAISFLKSQCIIYRNNVLIDDVNIAEGFDYNSITMDNFSQEIEKLKSYIKLKFLASSVIKLNKFALDEISKLKKLRDRLFNEQLSAELSAKELEKLKRVNENFCSKDKEVVIREFKQSNFYKQLQNPGNYDLKLDVDKAISTLINYINNDKKSYAFDALKFETTFNTEVETESVVDINFPNAEEIEFPDIILANDKGIPVILLTELNLLQKIIFHSTSTAVSTASFSKFKSTMECPLFLHNDNDLSESIGYFYTLTAYKGLLDSSSRLEPRTRKIFFGGIVLSEEFDKYNDYVLAATYFNFKKVSYNVPLFYYVLWKMCEKKEWMDRNVVDQFKKYILRRISQYVCRIGLSSLPLDPQEIVPLPAALWYCVELSSYIFKDDEKFYTHERLRMFCSVADCMMEILELLNYNLDKKFIKNRIDLLKHVSILKRIGPTREKVYFLLEKIFKNDQGFLVCEIEHPENIKKLNYLKLNHKEMLREDVLMNKINLEDFVYFLYHVDSCTVDNGVKICEKTLRPFFVVQNNSSFYSELIKYTKQVTLVDNEIRLSDATSISFQRILSLYNLFIRCVNDLQKYPTLLEYMAYVLKRKQFHEELTVIFSKSTCDFIKGVFLQYQKAIENIDLKEFIKRTSGSVNRVERIKKEEIKKFQNEDEIEKFIFDEELKVNLRKVKVSNLEK